MANTKQAKKMVRKIKRKTSYNKLWKDRIKTKTNTLNVLLSNKTPNKSEIDKAYILLQKDLDKVSIRKIFHPNKTKRLKSQYQNKINSIFKSTEANKTEVSKKST